MEETGFVVKGVTEDSRRVKPGYVFVAIEGEMKDGNSYIHDAINRGASLILSEKELMDVHVPWLQVKDARLALAKMNALFYGFTAKDLHVIGVTGTNGKTTTTHMIETIFRESGREIAVVGGLGMKCGNYIMNSKMTTPSSEELNQFLYRVAQNDIKWVTMEVSSHGLKQRRVEEIDFDTAVFTNISYDHMDYHKSFEDYFSSKKMLFQGLKGNKRAIINGDDPWGLKMIEGKNNIYVITYGLKTKSTITASSIDLGQTIRFTYCLQRALDSYTQKTIEVQEFPIEINLLGYHNIYNALAAITVALIYDIPVHIIQRALKRFMPISRRLEYSILAPYYILDDYAHNPGSFHAVFEVLQSLDYQNAYVVVAIRGNRGVEINKENAEVIANWIPLLKVKKLFVTDSQEAVEEKDKVSAPERETFLKVLRSKHISFEYTPYLQESFHRILKQGEKKDLIVLLGAQGMDRGKEILGKLLKKNLS